ncbi:MAG: helix-turn-helix transcriptional regulator [Gemmatimonadetes bacterium]|nr:helix-turn-helix transcriptional regulator [Gemmatimonadota bacterium]
MRDHEVAGQLPLTPLAFHILLALLDGDLHGYGVLKEIDLITRGQMTPTTGPVYLAAQRLLGSGLIEESDKRPVPELDDQRRKYYRLTGLGRRVANAEAARMAYLVDVAVRKGLLQGRVSDL